MKEDLPGGEKPEAVGLPTGVTQELLDLQVQAKATDLRASHTFSGVGSTMMHVQVTSPWVWPPTERGIRGGTRTFAEGTGRCAMTLVKPREGDRVASVRMRLAAAYHFR